MTRSAPGTDSAYAWWRLSAALALMTLGASGMYAMSVALPPVQAEFGVTRAEASMPYTFNMIGFGLGSIVLGRLADRRGATLVVWLGAAALGAGYIASGLAENLWQFSLAQAVLIGFLGTASTLAPLVADTAQWFVRRRGIAVAIVMSGNYLAGTVWPPVMQHFFDRVGWRTTFIGTGVFCALAMALLALALRRKPPGTAADGAAASAAPAAPAAHDWSRPLGLSPTVLQGLLCVAGVSCCVAMSMPQVHMVAYCGDLGYASARGAEMLSLMLGFGILSRLVSGWVSDHIGGLRTLLLGAVLQAIALALFLPYTGLVALYVVSALFGLFQGGLVPSYAIIVREYFSPREAGLRTGTVLTATLFGMALGGWMPGAIFDATGSYRTAFVNGIAWSLVTAGIALYLLRRSGAHRRHIGPQPA